MGDGVHTGHSTAAGRVVSAGCVVSSTVGHTGQVAGIADGEHVDAGSFGGGGGGGGGGPEVATGTPAPRISNCFMAKKAAAG